MRTINFGFSFSRLVVVVWGLLLLVMLLFDLSHCFAHCWCVGYLSLTDSKSIKCNTATRPISVLLNLLLFGFRCEVSDSKNGTNERIKNLSVGRSVCMRMCMGVRTRETKQNKEKKSKKKWKKIMKTNNKDGSRHWRKQQHKQCDAVRASEWVCMDSMMFIRILKQIRRCVCVASTSFYGMYRHIA